MDSRGATFSTPPALSRGPGSREHSACPDENWPNRLALTRPSAMNEASGGTGLAAATPTGFQVDAQLDGDSARGLNRTGPPGGTSSRRRLGSMTAPTASLKSVLPRQLSPRRSTATGMRTRPTAGDGGLSRPVCGDSTAGLPLSPAGDEISTVAQLWRTSLADRAHRESSANDRPLWLRGQCILNVIMLVCTIVLARATVSLTSK
jgi:hypothetical protein